MTYMMLIYEPEEAYEGPAGETALAEVVARHMALGRELTAAGVAFSGDGLQHTATATTVHTDLAGAQTLHDGPFAETREHLGGYYRMELADLDQALAWARKIPVTPGGKVEVRPVAQY